MTMRTFSTKRKSLFALGFIGLALCAWWIMQPRYQGHSMNRWFERYLEDFTFNTYNHRLPMSKKQEEAIQAFRYFGESGVQFLVRDLDSVLMEFPKDALVYKILKMLPWNSQRDFRMEWMRRAEGTVDLFWKVGLPYDWAVQYGRQATQTTTQTNAFALEMIILNGATNQNDLIVAKTLPYVTSTNSQMRYLTTRILSKTNISAHAAIPSLLNLPPPRNHNLYQLCANLAPTSPEIQTLLEKWLLSDDPYIVFHAALAAMRVDGNQERSVQRIEQSIERALEDKVGRNKHTLNSMLRTLVHWPYSIEPLIPTLTHLANRSDAHLDRITDILYDHQIDISPLFPKIKNLLQQKDQRNFRLCLFMLHQDFEDPTAWLYLDQTMAQLGTTIPIMCNETALIQLLAPHSPKAQDLLNRYPRANHKLHPEFVPTTRAFLRKYVLPPTKANPSKESP